MREAPPLSSGQSELLAEHRLTEAVLRCERLPVMDRSVQRVLALTADPESSTAALIDALQSDAELATNVVRHANSAYAARPIRARTIRQAVTMLGRRSLRKLCLDAVTFRFFETAPGNGRLSRGQLHLHAVTVANVSAAAAHLVGLPEEVPHLAGLLHDCGKIVMPLAFGEPVMDSIALHNAAGDARAAMERDQLYVDHAMAGALLARLSGLDEEVVTAIGAHHSSAAPSAAAACLQLANTVVRWIEGVAPDHDRLERLLEQLGLYPEAVDALAERAACGAAASGTYSLRLTELERLAGSDELTGVANRRRWTSVMNERLETGCGGQVLLCDVDHFKQINDSHGHATGDLVLGELARILDRRGFAGRLGGDEFVLWVDAEDTDAAEWLLDEVSCAFPGPTLPVRISIGVARAQGALPDVLKAADLALYAAKAAGRSRACRADALSPATGLAAATGTPDR